MEALLAGLLGFRRVATGVELGQPHQYRTTRKSKAKDPDRAWPRETQAGELSGANMAASAVIATGSPAVMQITT